MTSHSVYLSTLQMQTLLKNRAQQSAINVGAQLSWESICLTSRGSQVRALLFPPLFGPVVQLVRTLACHARGRRFEPVPGRHFSCANALVAQLVEQRTENPCVDGSIPSGGTKVADVAHLVERHLAKVEVAGSSPVIRSSFVYKALQPSGKAEVCKTSIPQFESGWRLQKNSLRFLKEFFSYIRLRRVILLRSDIWTLSKLYSIREFWKRI